MSVLPFTSRQSRQPLPSPRLTGLAPILAFIIGKSLDAFSTAVVLHLASNVYESIWYTRTLIQVFGITTGNAIAFVTITLGYILFVETITYGFTRLNIAPALHRTIPYYRTGLYLTGALWFIGLGIHNFSLLL